MNNNWLMLFHGNHDLDPASRQEVFRQLWEDWWPRLRVYLSGFTSLTREDAEELASDALLRAMDKADSFDPSRPFAPWLFTLARHLAIAKVRQLRRRSGLLTNPALLGGHAELPGPEESLLLEEDRSMVATAVISLPEHERELACLIYGAGLGLGETARITGQPLGTVKWRVHRLKAAIRSKLEDTDAW